MQCSGSIEEGPNGTDWTAHGVTPGVLEFQARVFGYLRGSLSEPASRRTPVGYGIGFEFFENKESYSVASGVVGALHPQTGAHAQDRLVRALRVTIFDVLVDVQPTSPTLREHAGVEPVAEDDQAFWVAAEVTPGFCTPVAEMMMSSNATDFQAPEGE